MLKLITVSAVLGASLAQVEQGAVCQSSQLQTFQFCLRDFALDVDIFWNHNGQTVDFLFESIDDGGWRSIGWSSGAAGFSMFPSNVVVGCLDPSADIAVPIPGDYEIFGGRAQGVGVPAAQMQGLQNLQQQRVNGMCIVSFTRPVAPPLLDETRGHDEGQVLDDKFVRTIVAGGGEILGQHPRSMRTRFDVNYQQGIGAASTLSTSVTIAAAVVSAAVASLFQ